MIKGKVISDWSKFDINNPEHLKTFVRNAKAYLQLPDRDDVRAVMSDAEKIQMFTQPADTGAQLNIILKDIIAQAFYDNAYERFFDVQNFTRGDSFKIGNMSSGLTFVKMADGEQITYNQVSGSRATVYFDKFGGGLSFDADLFEDQDGFTVEKILKNFRNQAYRARALAFTGLIEAVPSTYNVAWQNPDPATLPNTDATYTANRDAQTIATAYTETAERCKDLGLDFIPGVTPMILFYHYTRKARIMKALSLVLQAYQQSQAAMPFVVEPVSTSLLVTPTVYYVGIPGGNNVAGYRKDLSTFDRFNQDSYTLDMAGWMRAGGVIETKQLARCAMS